MDPMKTSDPFVLGHHGGEGNHPGGLLPDKIVVKEPSFRLVPQQALHAFGALGHGAGSAP
jgi:hypothetical protein